MLADDSRSFPFFIVFLQSIHSSVFPTAIGMCVLDTLESLLVARRHILKSNITQLLDIYTVLTSSGRSSVITTTKKPIRNRLFLVLFASIRHSGTWFAIPSNNILKNICFSAPFPSSQHIVRKHQTDYQMRNSIAPATWCQIFDGLCVNTDSLILDMAPKLGKHCSFSICLSLLFTFYATKV